MPLFEKGLQDEVLSLGVTGERMPLFLQALGGRPLPEAWPRGLRFKPDRRKRIQGKEATASGSVVDLCLNTTSCLSLSPTPEASHWPRRKALAKVILLLVFWFLFSKLSFISFNPKWPSKKKVKRSAECHSSSDTSQRLSRPHLDSSGPPCTISISLFPVHSELSTLGICLYWILKEMRYYRGLLSCKSTCCSLSFPFEIGPIPHSSKHSFRDCGNDKVW